MKRNTTLSEKIQDYFEEANIGVIDRKQELKQAMYAMLTREHLLLKGPAGTAKSLFANRLFGGITAANTFSTHITKQTTEEYLFGPIDFAELKKGNIIHNTKGSILDADFAFLDEFFDASDVLLRSLLGVLNERKWMKAQGQDALLKTAILTSNYDRNNEVTEAVLDRVMFKTTIQPMTSAASRKSVISEYLSTRGHIYETQLSLEELGEAHEKLKHVTVPDSVISVYDSFVTELSKEINRYISARTINKCTRIIQAAAYIEGRTEATFKDIGECYYALCEVGNSKESDAFAAVMQKIVIGAEEQLETEKELEEVSKLLADIPVSFDKVTERDVIIELTRELTGLKARLESASNKTKAKPIKKRADALIADVLVLARAAKARMDVILGTDFGTDTASTADTQDDTDVVDPSLVD